MLQSGKCPFSHILNLPQEQERFQNQMIHLELCEWRMYWQRGKWRVYMYMYQVAGVQ